MKNGTQIPRGEGVPVDPIGAALGAILVPLIKSAVAEALAGVEPPKTTTLMTRDEAAAFLRISTRQLDLLRRGENPPPEHVVGDSPRYVESELLEWTGGRK